MNQVLLFFLTLDYGQYVISLLVFIKTKANNISEIRSPLPWNNLNQLSIGFSYLKNKLDMILKIVLNLYVTVERVQKQLISSFDIALAVMFKG